MTATFTRTITPKSGNFGKSLKFAKKRLAAVKAYCGVDVELKVRIGGPGGQLIMISHHKGLAEIEEMRLKIMEGVLSGDIPQPKSGVVGNVRDAIWVDA